MCIDIKLKTLFVYFGTTFFTFPYSLTTNTLGKKIYKYKYRMKKKTIFLCAANQKKKQQNKYENIHINTEKRWVLCARRMMN